MLHRILLKRNHLGSPNYRTGANLHIERTRTRVRATQQKAGQLELNTYLSQQKNKKRESLPGWEMLTLLALCRAFGWRRHFCINYNWKNYRDEIREPIDICARQECLLLPNMAWLNLKT